jgi:exopolysaccharide biosynthesis polyprenyl glycosylphosphotransferase
MGIKLKKYLLFFFDIILIYFSLYLALFLRYFQKFETQIFLYHLFPFTILFFLWLIIFYTFGFYDFEFLKTSLIFKTISVISFNFILGVLLFYFIPKFKITPKTILILNSLIFGFLFFFSRKFFLSFFSTHLLEKVAILGKDAEVEKLKKEIKEKPFLGYELVEIDLSRDLLEQIKKEKINTIVFTEEFEKDPKFQNLFYDLLFFGINFLDFPSFYEKITEKIPVTSISKVWFFENLKEGEKRIYDKFKRVFDVMMASIILLLTLPLWLLIALAIKIEDRGPIFYLQERVGKNKKIFKLIKFRSMIKEAEKEGPKWAEIEDQRVTKVGNFLRRFHLDEIPQMINVIRGDISLVGPRPERPEFVEKLEREIPYYNLRHIIKPGFTGWAQIKFRYARSVEDSLEKFQYDLYYIKNRSLFLDVKILLKTFQLFLKKE